MVNAQVGGVRGDAPNRTSRTVQKHFFHRSLVIYLIFGTPPIKLKLRLQTGGRLLIASHLDQLIMIGQSESGSSGLIRFTTVFSGRLMKLSKYAGAKP
jgi:hypothetical protein